MTTLKNVCEGEKKLKILIGFLSASKIDNCNRVGVKRKKNKKRKKKSKRIYRTSQKKKKNKCFSWVTAVRVLSLSGSHSPPHLPGMPSNTVLNSGPAVGAAQILLWPYSHVFLLPVSTAVRTSAFSFVGAHNVLLHTPQTQRLPSWSCGFNLQPVQLVGRFWVLFLSHTAPGFQLWFYFHLCRLSTGICSWGCPGGLGFAPVRAGWGGGAAALL